MLIAPLLLSLSQGRTDVEPLVRTLLDELRTWPQTAQGYAPANLIALLRFQRSTLRGLDLSRLMLRAVYLQGVEMQDTRLVDATLQNSMFTETFDALTAVAVSSDGQYWAASSTRGEVLIWEAGAMSLYRVWNAHADMAWVLAFSPDAQTLATGSWDGKVNLRALVSVLQSLFERGSQLKVTVRYAIRMIRLYV